MDNSATKALYDLLVTRDLEPEILDSAGRAVTDPGEAELFSFDYKTENANYGTVVVLVGGENDLEVYYGDNLGRTMEGDDKQEWYDFLAQLKQFASRNMLTFQLNNINRLKYTMQGMAAIKEGLFEGYYGKRDVSYRDEPKKTRLMIKHSRNIPEGEARYRAIESLYVETADGERFRVPTRSLMHGRMLARHCAEGGTPYDAFGQHIGEVIHEINTLGRFVRAAKNRQLGDDAVAMVEQAVRHYQDLKAKAKHMISQRGYHEARENFDPAEITEAEQAVDTIREMFLERMLDPRIEEALPVLAKLQQESKMKEINEFASWADGIAEGTWALPDSVQAMKKLQDMMSRPLPVGADATNATEQLYDIVGDDELFDALDELAEKDPNANVWDDARVMSRLQELIPGIQPTPAEPAVEPTQENLDTDGVMMTKQSNMSSESRESPNEFNRLIELSRR